MTKTKAAYVAQIMRAELKDKFPGIKFSVRAETYSMGNSVNVSYEKSKVSPAEKDVMAVVKKYQAGHFDGMTDSYEYSNKTEGPTVQYVFVDCHYPRIVTDAVHANVPRSSSPEDYRVAYDKYFTELVLQA